MSHAVKAIAVLPAMKPRYSSLRLSYGKDRCAKYAALPDPRSIRLECIKEEKSHSNYHIDMSILTAEGKRTVYLGNIDPKTLCEDICDVVRGGVLSNIKHIAFVTFVDPAAAIIFMEMSTTQGVFCQGRKLKAGWGPDTSLNLPVDVIQAFRKGATRNIYVGGVKGDADEEKLKMDFAEYGELEQVNVVTDKNCGFVNFTNVLSAVKAVEEIRLKEDYIGVRISYGKDRCGNPPRHWKNGKNRDGNTSQDRKGDKGKVRDNESNNVSNSGSCSKDGSKKESKNKNYKNKGQANKKDMEKEKEKVQDKNEVSDIKLLQTIKDDSDIGDIDYKSDDMCLSE
ncbi:hypothetical protein BGX28_008748 [Mortierella sp. GBA30]|nr:hypothetical protein BGX28_008748 [Mortierella sp. GBA30]